MGDSIHPLTPWNRFRHPQCVRVVGIASGSEGPVRAPSHEHVHTERNAYGSRHLGRTLWLVGLQYPVILCTVVHAASLEIDTTADGCEVGRNGSFGE